MDDSLILIVSILVLAFGLVSKRVQRSTVTPPMIFVAFGLIASAPELGLASLDVGPDAVRVVAELTLVLVLFGDASRIDLSALRREYRLPLRLLAIGMPLTIALGTVAALLVFPILSVLEAALLATILAPTDAALGQSVVSDPHVPVGIRQALNVESGLNDGIALPAILVLAACAEAAASHDMTPWVEITVRQLALGPLVGVAVGHFGARLVRWAADARWMSPRYEQLSGLALALVAYTGAEHVGGNGFISAFVAGLALRSTAPSVCRSLTDFAETEGRLLVLVTFFLVGGVLVWPAINLWTGSVAVYAALSLSVVRMVPVAISVSRMHLRPLTILFLGWFGPRGLASILFGVLIVQRAEIPHRELILAVVMATALTSIFAHGLSAAPAARRFGSRLDQSAVSPPGQEREGVTIGVEEE